MALDEDEPAKLTEEMRTEINPESIDDMVKPIGTVSQEIVQKEYEETESASEPEESEYIETAKPTQVKKAKKVRPSSANSESQSLTKLQGELRKYSDSARKTELTLRDIHKKIKDIDKRTDAKQHQILRDLQTQVKELRSKIDRIERLSRSKSPTSNKKTRSKNKKSTKKKSRRR